MGKPVPEREAAKAAGERFYWTGKPCRNGHLSKRYTGTGACAACAVKNTLSHQAKAPEHPNRVAARERGEIHYSTGTVCRHGHDLRFTSNGICVACMAKRAAKYHAERPGLEAKWARDRRAKDPTKHRESSIRWAKNNREKVNETNRPALHRRRARQFAAEGSFTKDDVAVIRRRQRDRCAACGQRGKLEIDHIKPLSKGGSNYPRNLQLLCRSCNAQKTDKDPIDWAQSRGMLV